MRPPRLLPLLLAACAAQPAEAPRPLEGRGLENLVALTRMMGYVRYFHPSDQAAAVGWDRFAIYGVRMVEDAKDPAELARRLQQVFAPIAPNVRVAAGTPEAAVQRQPGRTTEWRHFGVGIAPNSVYHSRRLHTQRSQGGLFQTPPVEPVRGKRLRFAADVRMEGTGTVELGLGDGRRQLASARVAAGGWRRYEVRAEVPADAPTLVAGIGLDGEGTVWIDNAALGVEGEKVGMELQNAAFEEEGGWTFQGTRGGRSGFQLVTDRPAAGKKCGRIAVEADKPVHDPAAPFLADLGGGVRASIPMALYLDDNGTLPPAPKWTAPGPEPSGRAWRLAAVALAWNVFQHFYPYFDVVKVDWQAALRTALARAATDEDDAAFRATLRRLVAALEDGHGGVYDAAEDSWMPPVAWRWVEERLVVTHIMEGAPVKPGEVVLAVNGKPAAEAVGEEMALTSASTRQHRLWRAQWSMLAGPQNSAIALKMEDGRTVRAARIHSYQHYQPERMRPAAEEIRPGIQYLHLGRVSQEQFDAAVPRLAAARGIVFDMRGYPRVNPQTIGHLIDTRITCARWNIPIVKWPDGKNMEFKFSDWPVEPKAPRFRAKVVFITDGRALSYAETYMGMIEHYKLAEIVGEPTAGTNGNVNPFTLPGGFRVHWTGMKVMKHDGSRHHGVGILPTVPVSPTVKGIREGRDEQLERALEIVSR